MKQSENTNYHIYRDARLVALDYGMRRTGTAYNDGSKIYPGELLEAPNRKIMRILIKKLIKLNSYKIVVLGLPLDSQENSTPQSEKIIALAKYLLKNFEGLLIYFQNEFYSSKTAQKLGKKVNLKTKLDSLSASIILEDFLQAPNSNSKALTQKCLM